MGECAGCRLRRRQLKGWIVDALDSLPAAQAFAGAFAAMVLTIAWGLALGALLNIRRQQHNAPVSLQTGSGKARVA